MEICAERKRDERRRREKGGERQPGLRGRDSIKRTHINESFQGKTELYVDAGMPAHTTERACT